MFKENHYVAILPTQRGERMAVRDLSDDTRSKFTPLWELHDIPVDKEDAPIRSLDAHIKNTVDELAKVQTGGRPFFFDLPHVGKGVLLGDQQHPIVGAFSRMRDANLTAIPVVTLDHDAAAFEATKLVIAEDRRGVMIRVTAPHFLEAMKPNVLPALLAQLGVTVAQTHLLIDVGSFDADQTATQILSAIAVLSSPAIAGPGWQTLTLASGAFPETLRDLPSGAVHLIPRADFSLWYSVVQKLPEGLRRPTYGDYGIQQPGMGALNLAKLTMRAHIRYTAEQCWAIARGGVIKGKKAVAWDPEFRSVARQLVDSGHFRGASFSAGDTALQGCALGVGTAGSPATWRQHGTNHHIATVVDQMEHVVVP